MSGQLLLPRTTKTQLEKDYGLTGLDQTQWKRALETKDESAEVLSGKLQLPPKVKEDLRAAYSLSDNPIRWSEELDSLPDPRARVAFISDLNKQLILIRKGRFISDLERYVLQNMDAYKRLRVSDDKVYTLTVGISYMFGPPKQETVVLKHPHQMGVFPNFKHTEGYPFCSAMWKGLLQGFGCLCAEQLAPNYLTCNPDDTFPLIEDQPGADGEGEGNRFLNPVYDPRVQAARHNSIYVQQGQDLADLEEGDTLYGPLQVGQVANRPRLAEPVADWDEADDVGSTPVSGTRKWGALYGGFVQGSEEDQLHFSSTRSVPRVRAVIPAEDPANALYGNISLMSAEDQAAARAKHGTPSRLVLPVDPNGDGTTS